MKANPYISIREKRFLIVFTILIFTLMNLNMGLIVYEDTFRNSSIDFSICGTLRANFIPHFRFFSLLIPVFLFLERKFIFGFLSTFLAVLAFSYENVQCFLRFFEEDWLLTFFEKINLIARPLDYLVFSLIFVLLIWQISIFYRIRKTKLI